MIKFTNGRFMSFQFTQALQGIATARFPAKTAYQIKKMADKMQKERERISKEYRDLLGQYATKDEKGELVHPDKDDPNSFDVPTDKMEAYKAAEKSFGETEFTVNVSQLTIKAVENLEFSPAELSLLEPLFEAEEEPKAETIAPVVGQIGPKAGA